MTVRGPHELLLCLRQILTTEKFADVTIYCSGRKLRAHKLLLSASSPYLQKLLSINNSGNEESFIIIDSIAYEDMKSLLEFMYTGGTRVREERIELFLEAARALDVRVLCGEDYGKARVPNKGESSIGIMEDQIMTSDLRTISIDKIRETIERNVREEILDTKTLVNGIPAVPWVQPWMTTSRCHPYSRTYYSPSPTTPHCIVPSFPQQIQASTPPPARSAPLPSVPYVLASTPPPSRSAPPLATPCLAATAPPPPRSVPHLLPLKTRPGGIVTPCPWAQHGLPPLGLPPRRTHHKSECKIEKEPLLPSSPDARVEEANDCIKTTPPAADLRPTNGKKLYALKERRLQEFYREQRLNGETKKEIKEESESECSSDLSQEDKNNNNVINGAKRCGECGLLLGSREALTAHGQAEHGKGCLTDRSSEVSTGSQISNISDSLVRCKECGLEFTTEKALSIHVTTHHSLSDLSESQCTIKDSSGPARCEDCGLEFSSGEALAGHGKAAHGKPYTCLRCSKQFVHRGHWAAHQRLHVEPKQQHPCSHCPKVFLTRASLKVHIRTHTGEKPFQCTDCGKQFSQLRNYKYHRSVHEGTREFAATCPECGKYFNDRGYLSSHMKIHRNRKEYACEYCGKSFNQRVAYNMHVRIHTGLKPHSCPHCPKSFSRKMLLKQHLRIHTGEKPFSCVVCGKAFADRSNMTLHMRLHSGVKPYSCNLCSKAFTKKHHLKTHMNYHTGVKPYSCGKCGLKFSQSSNMRTHFKKCNAPSPTPSRDTLPQPPPELRISSSS